MSGAGDSKTCALAAIKDNYVEDAGRLKKEDAAHNIRQPHQEIYAEALQRYPSDEYIDKTAEAKLRRKLDYNILPLLSICYFFYYVDKTTLSYAAIFGIKNDLALNAQDYSWLSSIFYFGWLVWAIPSNLIMQRSPPGWYLSANIFLWGVFLMAQAGVHNFAGLAVLRIISGAFEAIADPAFMLITSMYYTRPEQPIRISVWYAFNGVGVAGGGLIGYGIGNIKGALQSWRYEFLIVGAFCTFWSLPNGGISNFSTLVIQGLGFDTLHTALLGIPQGVLVVIWIGLGAVCNYYMPKNCRTLVSVIFMLPTIAGALGFLLAPPDAYVGRLICFYLTGSYQASFVISLSVIIGNTGGQSKKMIVGGMIWLGACAGNITGPFFYKSEQAPRYPLGIGSLLVANFIELALFFVLRYSLMRENKRKEKKREQMRRDGTLESLNDTAFKDLTDKENPNFEYIY
ncbi:major facilitator superfamily domain-containing protein [Xylaria acuta]|nr:major facilitator superfamily domain-containing protein [Xylaria acuta]